MWNQTPSFPSLPVLSPFPSQSRPRRIFNGQMDRSLHSTEPVPLIKKTPENPSYYPIFCTRSRTQITSHLKSCCRFFLCLPHPHPSHTSSLMTNAAPPDPGVPHKQRPVEQAGKTFNVFFWGVVRWHPLVPPVCGARVSSCLLTAGPRAYVLTACRETARGNAVYASSPRGGGIQGGEVVLLLL